MPVALSAGVECAGWPVHAAVVFGSILTDQSKHVFV